MSYKQKTAVLKLLVADCAFLKLVFRIISMHKIPHNFLLKTLFFVLQKISSNNHREI